MGMRMLMLVRPKGAHQIGMPALPPHLSGRDAPVVSGLRPHADARPAQTVRVARPIACVAGRDRASRRPPAHARQPAERAHADPARRARRARHDRRHGTRHVAPPRRRGRARLAA
nr:MAG TPA: hypothetical protein [Caudoviricetes sp.]